MTEQDDTENEVVVTAPLPPPETYGLTPLEDRYGRSLWIRTRKCFCPISSPTDCRFHSIKERGWEVCPSTPVTSAAKKDKSIKGIWLWAHNPLYGKNLTEDEIAERNQEKAAA